MDGVKFGTKHSDEWGLLMLNNPTISSPEAQLSYVPVPGSDGVLDLSESLTGKVQFNQRQLEIQFFLIRDKSWWQPTYSEIADYLHGQTMDIVFDSDPQYYYHGRCFVSSWEQLRLHSLITITCTVDPYKYDLLASDDDWEWDTFSFVDGIIRSYTGIEVTTSKTVTVYGSRMWVIPVFDCDIASGNTLTVALDGGTAYALTDGENRVPQIVLKDGEHTLTFAGNGTVDIIYAIGRL